MPEISIRAGGAAGDGIASIGETLSRSLSRMGLNVFGFNAYQSVIRGGHVWFQARGAAHPIHSQGDGCDLIYALNKETAQVHLPSLRPGGTIVHDPENFALAASELPPGTRALEVPTLAIARKFTSSPILQNAGGLGAVAYLAGIPLDLLQKTLADSFGAKKGEIAEWNVACAAEGHRAAEQRAAPSDRAVARAGDPKYLLTGNTAIALGAAAAGCKFLAQYPMTPASSIMHWMAAHSHQIGVVVKQAEDELAAIHMAIGASFGGVRAMTATSGGGFSLMVEALGMAGMTEVPLVVVESQRAGPSTGLPTKTEQGDLGLMLGAGQGEFPRAILAPADPAEAYRLTIRAFQLAEEWQTPILLASDLHLSENYATVEREALDLDVEIPSLFTVEPNGHDYLRYRYTPTGVSPRAIPGQPGLNHVAGSDEHDERGHLISDVKSGLPIWVEERRKMMDKRMGKLAGLARATDPPRLEGPADAPLTFVAWGSTLGAVRDAMGELAAQHRASNALVLPTIYPLHREEVGRLLRAAHRTLLVEANYSGQLGRLVRAETGVEFPRTFLKYDGEPFYPGEIVARAVEVLDER
jgi:2-oxoglutarate/2-oxoacid ferredoxin oxidoreductase subunit alpha